MKEETGRGRDIDQHRKQQAFDFCIKVSGRHYYGFLPEKLASYPQKSQKGRDTVP